MRVLAPWRQRAAVAPGGAAAEEGQPLEVARKSAAAGAVDPGEAAQPLEVARKSGRSGDLIEEAGLVAARPPPPRSRARRALRAARRRPLTIATVAVRCSAGVAFSTEHNVETDGYYLNVQAGGGAKIKVARRLPRPSARRRGTG